MAESAQQAPILILHELDQRSRHNAHALPQQVEVKTTWDGVGLKLAGTPLVVSMDQVKEILTTVTISRIPGAKEWVRGVANVRGNLLPILDLNGFIFGSVAKMRRSHRVLVMQHKGVTAGLVVDEVLGMRHFLEEEFSEEVSRMDKVIQPYLSGVFRQGGEAWGVLDIHRLIDMPEFMQVAAA
ncbi:MAG: chemotaxis protein CheW [Pseudomonadota bacterium]